MTAKLIFTSHRHYPKQLPYIGCGGHQLRTLFQHTTGEKLQKKFPWFVGPHRLTRYFKKHNLPTHKKSKGSIEQLRVSIDKGIVPVLLIGRGYNNKSSGFNRIKALFFQHYISLRGYDDEQQIFYCYDSTVRLKNNPYPIGNKVISYTTLQRAWSWGGVGFFKRFSIEVGK